MLLFALASLTFSISGNAQGTVVSDTAAKIQFVHAVPDATQSVEVLYNKTLLASADELTFKGASDFERVSTTPNIVIRTTAAVPDTLLDSNFTLKAGQSYILLIKGLVNNDVEEEAVSVDLIENAKAGSSKGKFSYSLAYTSPGEDSITVYNGNTQIAKLGYGDTTTYWTVDPIDFKLTIREIDGIAKIDSFDVDAADFDSLAALIIITGSPVEDAPQALAATAILSDGNVETLNRSTIITSVVSNLPAFASIMAFPNPAIDNLNLNVNTVEGSAATIEVLSLSGQSVKFEQINLNAGSNLLSVNTANLLEGQYVVKISNEKNVSVSKFTVIK